MKENRVTKVVKNVVVKVVGKGKELEGKVKKVTGEVAKKAAGLLKKE
ncbi:MAG: hypothetical protein KAI70_04380 [Candidatus Omnitrophica bacterium]|nr:hypothetical protein [Candidatus Omnitrophota bacterium]